MESLISSSHHDQRAEDGAEIASPPRKLRKLGYKKTQSACLRCREKKIKCSGELPCQHCVSHHITCKFANAGTKVLVSERELQDLRHTVAKYQQEDRSILRAGPVEMVAQPAFEQSQSISQSLPEDRNPSSCADCEFFPRKEETRGQELNPLTSSTSFFVTDSSGRQRYLGQSSTWSFSWQIRKLLKEALGSDVCVNLVPPQEGGSYKLASMDFNNPGQAAGPEQVPKRDQAEYLMTTVLFYFGSIYHFFDKDRFLAKLEDFYDYDKRISRTDLWHIEFLLVMALGKLLLGRGVSDLGPPGTMEFLQAMKLLPNTANLYREQVIGQARSIALSIGMHRETPPMFLDQAECEHRRRLWWTVYTLDRKLSMNMGTPATIQDQDVDLALPEITSRETPALGLSLHVKLAALTGKVVEAAYAMNGAINTAYVMKIQDVFSSMKKTSKQFTGDFSLCLSKPGEISRAAATLHLLYYQCTIQATRPIMFNLVQKRLAHPGSILASQGNASDAVVSMIKTCVGAATTSLKILHILHEQASVEPYLPFDLEAVFSSAFILVLTTIAYPSIAIDDACIATAHQILDWMCKKNYSPAESRKKDLYELEKIASKMNLSTTQGQADAFDIPSSSDGLWNALNLDSASLQPTDSTFSIEGLLDIGMSDEQWFWAINDDPDLQGDNLAE